MPSKKEPPKMLESVLKAIVDLKESQGSTVRNIVNQIKSNPERQTGRRNYDITSQVRRALTQGKKAGIIVNNARKYKLTTTPSKCSNLLARSHAGKRSRKSSKRRRKGRSTNKRRRRRRSDSASVSEASDHPSEASSTHGADGTVTEANRKRRSRSKKRSKRRSRRRRQEEESCDDGTDDDEDEEETRRKRPRRSESEKGSSHFRWQYVLFAKQNFCCFR